MKSDYKVFDVAILGTGLSGLIAATQLARERRSVLLLKEKKYRLPFKRDGYCFVPFSNFSEKLIQTNLLKKISRLTDRRGDQSGRDKIGENVLYQVILPGARIDIFREIFHLQREWKREFPGELNRIENFYGELERIKQLLKNIKSKEPAGSFFPIHKKSLIKKWLHFDNLPRRGMDQRLSSFSPEFRRFVELQMISRGNLLSSSFPLSLGSHLLINDKEDGWERETGLESVTQCLFEKLVQSGVRIEEIEKIENIERKGSFSLHLQGDERVLRARSFILNSSLHSVSDIFGKRGKALSGWGKKIRPRYVLVPTFLGIRERVIPVGMKDLLISVQNLEKPYENGNLLLLSLSRRGDVDQAPEGKRALTVMSFKPFEGSEKKDPSELQDGVMNHLIHLFPFIENHIEFIDRTWAEDQMESWSYPHYYYEVDSNLQWRSGIVPIRVSKHLYFSGRENFPYLGLEGEILSGLLIGGKILKNNQ
jgi:phytoene dehydrogenase-like protein